MTKLMMSGAGGSNNWLPLIIPLAAVVALWLCIDFSVKWWKKRKVLRENQLVKDLTNENPPHQ